jgi:adenine-specific DNA-methyltransferase
VAQRGARARKDSAASGRTEVYQHPEFDIASRPEVGTQPQFRKRKPPVTYRYDSSLSPSLEWDGRNDAREQGEWLLKIIEEASKLPAPHEFDRPREVRGEDGRVTATCRGLRDAVDQLKRIGRPFLDWAGKAERLSFHVPTLPLFVHERLATKAIIETLKSHTKEARGPQLSMSKLLGDPRHPVADQLLRAYEYRDEWVNRMILGDSLIVMSSLLHYEGLGGQVQMIYIDPPYGVQFGSNFQPFVRDRDVTHNADADMTREPEMVKAYRDTWERGLHSWLTYLRDRLLLARELLHPRGSVFVQINDKNLHHARHVLDEVFGPENFVSQIFFQTTSGFNTSTIATLGDFLLWYARDRNAIKVNKLFSPQPIEAGEGNASWVLLPDGSYRGVSAAEKRGETLIPEGARLYFPDNLISQGGAKIPQPFVFEGKTYDPGPNHHWKANYPRGMERLVEAGRIHVARNSIRYRRFASDFAHQEIGNIWTDTLTGSFTEDKLYVVQTNPKVIERCVLLTTDPGDLVLDPTCGSGWTAYVSEQWGRRWITIDTSRVPMALARQRLLTAAFPWYALKDETRGPAGGFTYARRQNRKGEEVGGIAPHIMLETIANDEPAKEEVLVHRPETDDRIIRVSGPFCVEATIPTPVDWCSDGASIDDAEAEDYGSYLDRMLDVLRRSPVLQVGGGKTVTLRNVRPPAKSLALSAEATVENGSQEAVALVFGPENGAVSERLVFEAAREAHAKSYGHLFVIGFAIQPNARRLVEDCESAVGVPATWVSATTDLMMGDLLKTMRSSQIFSVCGMPDVSLSKLPPAGAGQPTPYEVELLGLDVFDPSTMQPGHLRGDDVPAWLLDTDYNGLVFHGSQVFFPRTGAWEHLKKALKATHDESVWDHLAGTVSAPFEGGEHRQIAVKVIDDRGNELIVVKPLAEAV